MQVQESTKTALADEPSMDEIEAVVRVIVTWGGLRDRNLDNHAMARRFIIAANNARETNK